MTNQKLQLSDSLALADVCLREPSLAQALSAAVANDPLKLNLPPLAGPGANVNAPDAAALRVLAALYLQAELEQAGVIPVAEVLAQSRYSLRLTDVATARKLDEFAQLSRDWLDRNQRNQVFARAFGLGAGAETAEGRLINRSFQQRFAAFCSALTQTQEDARWGQAPGVTRLALARQMTLELLFNLGQRYTGHTAGATRRIHEQMQKALSLLNQPGLRSFFLARDLWDLLRQILGDTAPDFGRLLTRGQSGQRLLHWLASVAVQAQTDNSLQWLKGADPSVFVWAGQWLAAAGFAPARRIA